MHLELEKEEMKGETREALRRINYLKEMASSLELENKALKSMVAEMKEWQGCMDDIINAQTKKINKLLKLLDNQTIFDE